MDPTAPVREDEIDDEGYYQTPVVSTDGGSAPPSPPRLTSRPHLGSHLVLNLVNWHPLPSLWTTHRDGDMSSDDEMPATSLRYPIAMRSALLDITNTYWSDTEDDNDSDYDGDDEIEERQSRDDDVMVYMVESMDDISSPVLPSITPLPQVEGDPTSFEDDIVAIASPEQEPRDEGEDHQGSLDTMEVPDETTASSEDDMEYEQQDDDSTSTTSSSSNVAAQVQPAEYDTRASPIRYFRRLSLYDVGKETPRHQMLPFHRRHSMGEVAMVAV
jgi:hypothetical protein